MSRAIIHATIACAAALLVCGATPIIAVPKSLKVEVTPNEAARRVDVTVGGHPFTSYIWPERLKKPVLYPIRTAKGTLVTRGWPLAPRPNERTDHPHQVGLWFDYENVNGVDFWNNSDALKPDEAAKKGTIFHRRIVEAKSGADAGTLVADMEWVLPGGKTILQQRAEYTFRGDVISRTIDYQTTLTALDDRVVFKDEKDGLFGMRVARQLEQPATKPEVFTDVSGKPTPVPVLDNTGVTGSYLTSEGKRGDDAWATRGRWTMLAGTIAGQPVTLAILDSPRNPGFPTYWHARGYGLFAANPLGQRVFSNGRESLNLTIEPHASVTFRYRLLVLDETATAARLDEEFDGFTGGRRPSAESIRR